MALPEIIEIVPLAQPVRAEITVPGSKSITNRALILAALADGEVTLKGALWSEDTQVMTEALIKLGFEIRVEDDPAEYCNRTISVKGLGGKIPKAGTPGQPLELFVGNAGTAARFLAAFVCLGNGVYRLSGVPRMHERPQAALFSALRELGYLVESEKGNDKLPVTIFGGGTPRDGAKTKSGSQSLLTSSPTSKKCRVSILQSSQFASALLLSAGVGGWEIEIVGENADESPYVVMTSKLTEAFPWQGGLFQIEPDSSSGSYFWAVGEMETIGQPDWKKEMDRDGYGFTRSATIKFNPLVKVQNWPYHSGWQIDSKFPSYLGLLKKVNVELDSPEDQAETNRKFEKWGPNWKARQDEEYEKYLAEYEAEHGPTKVSRRTDLGDSIMTLIALAPTSANKIVFTDLGRLRVQECERVVALKTELTKCGARVIEEGDTLTVYPAKPGELQGAEIETYNDHRMAMCFAVLGLKVPGIKIKNPACVKKTFPNFFQKLAAPSPQGLGAEVWEIKDGRRTRRLSGEELFAG